MFPPTKPNSLELQLPFRGLHVSGSRGLIGSPLPVRFVPVNDRTLRVFLPDPVVLPRMKELPLCGLPALQSLSELRPPPCFHESPLSGSSAPSGSSQCKEPGFPRDSTPQHLALAVFVSTLSALLLLTPCPPSFRRLPSWGSRSPDLPP